MIRFMERDLDKEFPIEIREIAVKVASYISGSISFVPWSVGEKKEFWRKRSLNQIDKSGRVNYLVPCIDTAVIAASYLSIMRESNIGVILLTDAGRVGKFLSGNEKKLHLDAVVRLVEEPFFLDVGSVDITLLHYNGTIDENGQKEYITSRVDEPVWRRTPLFSVSGKELIQMPNKPIVEIMIDRADGKAPLGLSREDFYRYNDVADGDSFTLMRDDSRADLTKAEEYNAEWTAGEGGLFFPGLGRFRYNF
jgi:hypothetical protein